MRSRFKKRSEDDEAGIDMTPMLDIVFIMLIFFIVTTSFVKESGIEVNKPEATSATKKEKANILIGITAAGDIWIDKRRVDIRSVRANIEKLRAENPEGSVVIQSDKDSNAGTLVKVMDQVKLAGVNAISISAKTQEGL